MALLHGSTLFDRTKKHGFMIGPKHAYGAALEDGKPTPPDATTAPSDADNDPGTPPNLRDSGDSTDSCADCSNFDDSGNGGTCNKFNDYPVTPNEICDALEKEDLDNDSFDDGSDPTANGGHMRSQDAESI